MTPSIIAPTSRAASRLIVRQVTCRRDTYEGSGDRSGAVRGAIATRTYVQGLL